MIRFEYKFLRSKAPTVGEAKLNELGEDGWLLITIYQFEEHFYYVFGREKLGA
ncbi:unnamed protein product [marine sediment metagenome]|uniref:DUF4177 domain-containing protein n=1 Tax=marine sediment metagenome TaxID=412755 RepID=X0Y4Q7_9ZZZZ